MNKLLDTRFITFSVYFPDLKRHVKVQREGRLFQLAGAPILLFPVGVMCEAIERDTYTLYRWEKELVREGGHNVPKWPKPQWKVPNTKIKRWYSAAQILMAHEIHHRLSRGSWGLAHSRHFDLDGFLAEVRKNFYTVDAVTVLNKEKQP